MDLKGFSLILFAILCRNKIYWAETFTDLIEVTLILFVILCRNMIYWAETFTYLIDVTLIFFCNTVQKYDLPGGKLYGFKKVEIDVIRHTM